MKTLNLDQALAQISELLALAFAGEEIAITNGDQLIKIAPVAPPPPPASRFGCDRDKIAIADDFDAPLEDFQDYM
ncbi:MAG: DUF2281 domain-containing protein [Spirulinaceae cyanobacterium SM2_1_0]|nr:DUF2281 domain-containing protein [Spirulinaceae cyanobacterium SM2_1_0]